MSERSELINKPRLRFRDGATPNSDGRRGNAISERTELLKKSRLRIREDPTPNSDGRRGHGISEHMTSRPRGFPWP